MKLPVNDVTELVRSITLLVLVLALVLVLVSSGLIEKELLVEMYQNLLPVDASSE